MSKVKFTGIPTFRILDYEKALNFYVDFLGFKIDWEHRLTHAEPVYMQVSKNGLILHLSENKRFQIGVIVFVDSKGLNKYQKELSDRNLSEMVCEVLETDWGTLQMEIEDPFGNLLRFNEPS